MENMVSQQVFAKELIAEAGGDAKMKKAAGEEHLRINFFGKPCFVVKTRRTEIPPLDFFIRGNGGIVAAYDICVSFFGGAAHFLVHDRSHPVVAVHKGNIFAVSLSEAFLSG